MDKDTGTGEDDEDEYYDDDERGGSKAPSFDPEALDQFLYNITPRIEALLEKNLGSGIFDNYEVRWTEEADEIKCLHKL